MPSVLDTDTVGEDFLKASSREVCHELIGIKKFELNQVLDDVINVAETFQGVL